MKNKETEHIEETSKNKSRNKHPKHNSCPNVFFVIHVLTQLEEHTPEDSYAAKWKKKSKSIIKEHIQKYRINNNIKEKNIK